MTPGRSQSKLVYVHENMLRYATAPGRRLLFAGVAAVLAVSAGVGLTGPDATPGESILGSLFFAALLLGALAVSGFRHAVEFEASPAVIRTHSSIFGIRIRSERIDQDAELGVVVREIRMLEPETAAPRSKAIRGFLERRAALYRLYVENGAGVHYLAESSDGAELQDVGRTVADFLGIPYRYERL